MENGSESSRVQIPPSYLQALENYMCCYPFAETLELYTGRIWSLLLELLKYFLLHRTICKYRGHKGQLHNFYMSFHAILPTLDCRGNQFFISPMKATIIILLKKKTYWSLTPWPYFFQKRQEQMHRWEIWPFQEALHICYRFAVHKAHTALLRELRNCFQSSANTARIVWIMVETEELGAAAPLCAIRISFFGTSSTIWGT